VVQAIIPGQDRVFPKRIGETNLAAGGVLLEVVIGPVESIDIGAGGQVGVVDPGVGEGENTPARLAAEHALELGVVALAEEVLLLDRAAEEHAVRGGVTGTQADGTGVLVLDLDLDVHFGRIVRGHGLDVDLFEVFELVQALVGAAQLGTGEEIAVGELHFAAHDVVTRFFVALDGHPAHVDLAALVDDVGDVDGLVFRMLFHVHVGFGKGVAVVGVELGQGI